MSTTQKQPTVNMFGTYELWKAELVRLTTEKTGTCPNIYDTEARKWYNDGHSPYVTFRETFNMENDGE